MVKRRLLVALKIAVSLGLVTAVVLHANARAVADALHQLDPLWLSLSLALFVPQTLVSAWRWSAWIAPWARLTLGQSVEQTLAASALNLVVPSKLGDLSKAAFVPSVDRPTRVRLGALAMGEKLADLGCLALAVGLASPWRAMIAGGALLVVGLLYVARRLSRPSTVFAVASVILWSLHLTQIHCFLLAANVQATWSTTLLRIPLALVAGLLPVTWCGVGARDGALAWLYHGEAAEANLALVGLLTASRYLVPGLIGIPCLQRVLGNKSAAVSAVEDMGRVCRLHQFSGKNVRVKAVVRPNIPPEVSR